MTILNAKSSSETLLPQASAPELGKPLSGYEWPNLDFVYHESFDSTATEKELFGQNARTVEVKPWTGLPIMDEDALLVSRPAKALKAEDEKNLFLRYNYARCRLARLLRHKSNALSFKQKLAMWHQRASTARADLAQVNMALVLAMARRVQIPHLELEEMVCEGNMALLRCIDKFDVSRGFKFSTYACSSILKSFNRLARKNDVYRKHIPVNFDPELETPDVEASRHDVRWADSIDWVKEVLARNEVELTEVEMTVVVERFAMTTGGKGKTLAQIGKIVGLSLERVRQILNEALEKIRVALEEDVLVA